jgi:hypothetical protein
MKVLVTRHEALVQYFANMGLTFDKVIAHATPEDITGNDVYGVLPLHLASLADTVTTIDMNLPAEMRGKELSLEDIKKYLVDISTYKVEKI